MWILALFFANGFFTPSLEQTLGFASLWWKAKPQISAFETRLASLHHQLSFFFLNWLVLLVLSYFFVPISRWLDKEEIWDPRDCTTRCGRQKNFGEETHSLNWVRIPHLLLLVQKYYLKDQATPVSFHRGSMGIILCKANGRYSNLVYSSQNAISQFLGNIEN